MSSNRQILQDPMHKEIEAIKDRLGREIFSLSWNEYKKRLDKKVKIFLAEGGYCFEPTERSGISVIRKTREVI